MFKLTSISIKWQPCEVLFTLCGIIQSTCTIEYVGWQLIDYSGQGKNGIGRLVKLSQLKHYAKNRVTKHLIPFYIDLKMLFNLNISRLFI
jgi:hypothetical protein